LSFISKLISATNVFTFRDYILLPGRSEVEPKYIDLSTNLTKNIRLSIPLVSSPMDTVSGSKMALALAEAGGVGVIHRNQSVEDEVAEVKKVKMARGEAKSVDSQSRPLVGAAISPMDASRCEALDSVADFLVSDVAHFHNSNVIKAAAKIIPHLSKDFIAGNIGTNRAVHEIVAELPRVDGFRVGIGS
jgi:IMP dehydrogenase